MTEVKRDHYIAIGNGVWARRETKGLAVAAMRNENNRRLPDYYEVWSCTRETYVNDMGGFNRPIGHPEAVKVSTVRRSK